MNIAFDATIAAVRWVAHRDEAEGRLGPRSRDITRKASWRPRWWLVAVIRVNEEESSLGIHLRDVELHTAISPLRLRQLAHVARLGLEDRPARVRVARKAAPIAPRPGTESKAERVRA